MTTPPVEASFRVLVVDDMEVNRRLLERQVVMTTEAAECPSVCECAASGHEAIELCTNNKYDKIFMDYNMPGMNGGETTRKIRALDPHAHIVGCTSTKDETEIADCFDAGMEQVLPKPVDVKEIIKREIEAAIPEIYRKKSLE